jgi:hypothetical protein
LFNRPQTSGAAERRWFRNRLMPNFHQCPNRHCVR